MKQKNAPDKSGAIFWQVMVQSDAEDFVWMTKKEIVHKGSRFRILHLPFRASGAMGGLRFGMGRLARVWLRGTAFLSQAFDDLGLEGFFRNWGHWSARFPSSLL